MTVQQQRVQLVVGGCAGFDKVRKTIGAATVYAAQHQPVQVNDQYLVMERGEVVMQWRGADMERDGVRERMSI
jgi:urea transport system ATP-binding protein